MDEAFAHLEGGSNKKSKNNLTPPDGGWGYIVCVGVGFTFMLGFGSSSAFGILFNNFFTEHGGAGGLTLVNGVYNGALSIAGFFSGIALKKYSFRQVGLVGAGLFILGDLMTIFVRRTYHLVFTFGVVRGAGFGVMIPVSFTAFNCYFTTKRTAMMSANQTMSSIASITFPMLVTFLLQEYGFRWTLAIIMALDLHLVLAMLVMHPVEWHMIPKHSARSLEILNCGEDEVATKMLPDCDDTIEKKECVNHLRHESLKKDLIKSICDNIEVDLLKDPRFLSILIGIAFAFVSDVTYLAMEPMLLFSYGFSEMQVATCVMVGAITDLLARLSLAVITYFYVVDSRLLFYVGTCVTMMLRVALVSSRSPGAVFAVTAVSGVVRCSVQVLFPLVLAAAAPDRFPGALALHIIFSGFLMLIANPIIGLIYEVTGSYVFCFLTMSICCAVCIVLWSLEYCLYRRKRC